MSPTDGPSDGLPGPTGPTGGEPLHAPGASDAGASAPDGPLPREGTFRSAGPFTTGVEVAGALAELGVQRIRMTPHGDEPSELETREADLPGAIEGAIHAGAESIDLQALGIPLRVTIRSNEWSWAAGEERAARVFHALRPPPDPGH